MCALHIMFRTSIAIPARDTIEANVSLALLAINVDAIHDGAMLSPHTTIEDKVFNRLLAVCGTALCPRDLNCQRIDQAFLAAIL